MLRKIRELLIGVMETEVVVNGSLPADYYVDEDILRSSLS